MLDRQAPNGAHRRSPSLAVLLALLVAGLSAACDGPTRNGPTRIDQAAATQIARDFLTAGEVSSTVSNVTIMSIGLGSDAGRAVWKVQISGDVTLPGRTSPAGTVYEWLYIDADTGDVRLVAQG